MFCVNTFIVLCLLVGVSADQDGDTGSVCTGSIPQVEELPVKSNLAGKWISTECETRPGAKFVLRSYEFHANLSFSLDLHHYRDEWCSSPLYSARAHGMITDDSYVVLDVKVIPHTTLVARELQDKVNTVCPGFATRVWRANREYTLAGGNVRHGGGSGARNANYHTTSKRSRAHARSRSHYTECAHALRLEFAELARMRAQRSGERMELMLADDSGDGKHFTRGYQIPLLKIYDNRIETKQTATLNPGSILLGFFEPEETQNNYLIDSIMRSRKRNVSENHKKLFQNCAICDMISKSTVQNPPYLPTRPKLPVYLTGHWKSRSCESDPKGGYTLRTFEFREQTRRFHAKIRYFDDDSCQNILYTLLLKGEYYLGMYNKLLQGSTDVDFYTHKTVITIHESKLLEGFNEQLTQILNRRTNIQDFRQQFYAFQTVFARNLKYCDVDLYELDVPKVFGRTNCKIFGLENASFEKNVLKLEVDVYGTTLLSMGKLGISFAEDVIRDVEKYRAAGFKYNAVIDRASSYGFPLEHCESVDKVLEKQFSILGSGCVFRVDMLMMILVATVIIFY